MLNGWISILILLVFLPESLAGFTLSHPLNSITTYLLDQSSNVVQSWTDQDYLNNAASAYITASGSLLKGVRYPSDFFHTPKTASGAIREYNDSEVCIWEFRYSSSIYRLKDYFIVLPNGNALAVAWENHPWLNANTKGFTGQFTSDPLGYWSYTIIEIPLAGIENPEFNPDVLEPDGNVNNSCMIISDERDIVWKWDQFDHSWGTLDKKTWDINKEFSIDGIDYISSTDQIIINCGCCSEFFIIDHSIPMGLAQGTAGDFLFRNGNDNNFLSYSNRRLNDNSSPMIKAYNIRVVQDNFGWEFENSNVSIILFNNLNLLSSGLHSNIVQITLPIQPDGTYDQDQEVNFDFSISFYHECIDETDDEEEEFCFLYNWNCKPREEPRTYQNCDKFVRKTYANRRLEANSHTGNDFSCAGNYFSSFFFSNIYGGAQKLPNGNIRITSSYQGEILEIDTAHNLVWRHVNPFVNDQNKEGVKRPDQHLEDFDAFPICDQELSPCNSIISSIMYSSSFPGILALTSSNHH